MKKQLTLGAIREKLASRGWTEKKLVQSLNLYKCEFHDGTLLVDILTPKGDPAETGQEELYGLIEHLYSEGFEISYCKKPVEDAPKDEDSIGPIHDVRIPPTE